MLLLDPVSIPLNQNALIEASAGTGKTYTITTLYLRAILGLVENNETLTPKSIDQVLVVTFTEAATLEIKERVRLKLREAQQSLLRISEDVSGEGIDKNMYALFMLFKKAYLKSVNESDTSYETNNWCLAAYKRLQDALLLIDEASIFTIHGFCQRCLTQFAFETKSSFEQEFEMDAGPIWQQAVYDLWRRFVSPLTGSEFDWFRSYWADPKALFAELAPLVGKQVKLSPEIEEAEYQGLLSRFERLVRQLKHDWRQQEFSSCLSNSGLKKNTKIIKRLTKVEEFLSGDDWLADIDKDMGWYLYGSSSLQDTKNYKANSEFVNHEIIKIVDELAQVEEKLKLGCFKSYWLGLSRQYIEIKAHSIKEEQGIINPDDLLTELAAAVSSADGGLLLLEAIRRRYPLAFIDEFQDTDPIQYCIFETIYGEGRSDETTGNNGNGKPESADDEKSDANMLLIGDPKQAIYKFRGADIFTYIRAKEDLSSEQHYTLATNYRSHPKLIESVNTIFEKSELGFEHKQIPFLPVLAGKSEQNALVDTQKQAPLLDIFHLNAIDDDGEALSGFKSTDGERLIANWCVADIKSCLYGENYHSIKKGDNKERLTPGDICILVRNRNQAKIIKEQLAAQGLASVYLSRDSVFSSDLALDLYRLLKAVHTPNNEHYVRAALLTRIFAYDTQESLKLQREPELWQQHLVWFFQANELWQKGSIAAAIDTLLLNADTFSKWQHLYPQLVNRMVTDIRHLIELLQQQANKHSGVEKLFFWFEKQITQMGSWQEPGKEQQLRLESDSQLIQIATLHASKGLEYPVVYLPFISELKPAKSALYTSQSGDKSLTYRVDNRLLERQIAEQERLAEDIRLLYVAMTRPVYRLVVGLFNLTDAYKRPVFSQTGIGRLLLGEKTAKPTDGDIENVCRNLLALDGTSSNSQNRYLSMSATEVQTGYMQAESIQVPEQKSKQINLRARSFWLR